MAAGPQIGYRAELLAQIANAGYTLSLEATAA